MEAFLGIDVGSLTTKVVAISRDGDVLWSSYQRSSGGPIAAVQDAFARLDREMDSSMTVRGVGTTGSGRHLAGLIVGADLVKNEITAHAMAARHEEPETRTVIDIGGQDSKAVFLQGGVSSGFNMNTVCAAGTGSFLDHQAARLNVPISQFGELALRSTSPVRVSGRCGVFAESDLIHKQQLGYDRCDLIAGLCLALARNYLTNVLRSRRVKERVVFQGGVAANVGIRAALETLLGVELVVPTHFKVMGALGAALLARREMAAGDRETAFRGVYEVSRFICRPRGFVCADCGNQCEINELHVDGDLVSRWGSKCGRWEDLGRPTPTGAGFQEPRLRLGRWGRTETEQQTAG